MGSCASKKETITINSRPISVSGGNEDMSAPKFVDCDKFDGKYPEYKAVQVGMTFYCLDEFISKYTSEPMARWRAAGVKEIDPVRGCILVHFKGWKDRHDIWLKLKDETHRICPEEVLSEEQLRDGIPLDDTQYKVTCHFLANGTFPRKFARPSTSERESMISLTPQGTIKYKLGDKVDVRDIYKTKNKSHPVCKWRPAEVRGVDNDGLYVHIHYMGWGDEWDEVLNTAVDGDRIQPGGTMIVPRGSPRAGKKVRRRIAETSDTGAGSSVPLPSGDSCNVHGKAPSVRVTLRRRSYGGETATPTEKSPPRKNVSRTVSADNGVSSKARRKLADERITSNGVINITSGCTTNVSSSEHDEGENDGDYFDEAKYYALLKKESDFVARLNAKGLHVVEMDGDGNCLFRAVAHQIWLDEDRHLELRKMCVEHMESNAERFVEFCFDQSFAKHIARMACPGEWGDDLEIKALEEITDRPIIIYSSHNPECEPLSTNFDELQHLKGVKPILLSYHGQNHYNSVFDIVTPLPLEERKSCVILSIRKKLLLMDSTLPERK